MNTEITLAAPSTPAQRLALQAASALRAITDEAKQRNSEQLIALSESATEGQQAEHIRAVVAVTIGQLSADASDVTREHARQWGQWALDVADGVERGQPAEV